MRPVMKCRTAASRVISLTWLLVGPAALLPAVPAWADILVVSQRGNTILPQQAAEVSMDSEIVVVEPGAHGFNVVATFQMRNQSSQPVRSRVAFPVVSPLYERHMRDSFQVEQKGGGEPESAFAPIPVTVEMKKTDLSWAEAFYFEPSLQAIDYPGYVVWEMEWAPRETRCVRVRYDMGAREHFRGIVDGWRLGYVVRTGALWKGPIGRAEITFRFPTDEQHYRTAHTPILFSYPAQARWVSGKELTWHFENWEPTEDLWVASLGWVGLIPENVERFFLKLPYPYQGDQLEYTEATVDALVDRELAPYLAIFPSEIAALDRQLLRGLVAEWLYHEILARHGNPDLLGRCDGIETWPLGTVVAMDGYCYGRWFTNFEAYMCHGGWFKPNTGPQGVVRVEDLSGLERKNAEFLARFI